MNITETNYILMAGGYAPFGIIADYYIPETLWFKKVVANMESYNEESFRWAVTRALNPVDKNPQWVGMALSRQANQYNWDGLSFPTPLSQIETFERNNDVLVNVFRWNESTNSAHPIRVPFGKHNPRASLILIDEVKGHYVVIKSMQGLFRKQTGRNGKMFFCNNCMVFFPSDKPLQKHITCCDRLEGETSMLELEPRLRPKPKPIADKTNLKVFNNIDRDASEPTLASGLPHKTLPKFLADKKALINIRDRDGKCFKWVVTRALNPVDKNSEKMSKILRKQSEKYNWDGVSSPTSLVHIRTFEKNNDILINVFVFDEDKNCIYPIYVSPGRYEGRVLLILVGGRYVLIKSLSRLLGSQASVGKRHCKRFFCSCCLEGFSNELQFDVHITHLCESLFSSKREQEHACPGCDVDGVDCGCSTKDDNCDLCKRHGRDLCSIHTMTMSDMYMMSDRDAMEAVLMSPERPITHITQGELY